ncbi:hypothetical protein PoB_003870300 [Plakobranchus ocellatus]|uniref:Uncharacterized protein n=1 Tax=Plakobranchus ocellatus TaxID=259542 RepID=A0AAV4AZC0_9GAST|nr:hypothetical protein PoB_003870300 [Plakobranchus ocellatus]
MDTMVQWNICGFRNSLEELKPLKNRSRSAVVALQGWRFGEGQSLPWGYTLLLPREADWSRFGDLCRFSLDACLADIKQFPSKLLNAARSSIPFQQRDYI